MPVLLQVDNLTILVNLCFTNYFIHFYFGTYFICKSRLIFMIYLKVYNSFILFIDALGRTCSNVLSFITCVS